MRNLLALLLVPALLPACLPHSDSSTLSGTIELEDVHVGSLVGGRVLAVDVREGGRVSAGTVLVRLDPREWDATLAEARAQADAASKRLALLLAGTRPEQIAQAEAEAERQRLLWQVMALGSRSEEVAEARHRVEAAQAAAELALKEYARIAELAQTEITAQQELDDARNRRDETEATAAALAQRLALLESGLRKEEVSAAEASFVKARAYVDELKAGARSEEIAAARAELEAANARVAFTTTKIDELTIHAPSDAVVQTLDLRSGDLVAANATVAILLLPQDTRIRVYVPEDRLGAVTLGQRASIRVDGIETPYAGRVTWISREAEFTPRNVQSRSERVTQVFAVRVSIDGDVAALKDGLWGDVTFE
ncbi:MAG: HlyD family efflux transporter periplasmic adaptor subunit [Planctomycetes bacterium]|nr:HlyD family efflux transporter periplasmic adaptor subunit [Planctomycetota bacterium]